MHFSEDETGLQWEDYLFELQNAVEWRMVMSRGQDERSQMHAMSVLLNTCNGMTNRVLIDDGARWIVQGDEQERDNRTAAVKALCSMLAATTSGRAKELVKQVLRERNGMIAFGKIRERFGKTAGVAKHPDVFQFQWTSPDSLEDKSLRWQRLMRQVNMTSLGDDARETLTIAGVEKAKQRALEQQLRRRGSTDLDSVVCKCGSVLANDGGLKQSAHANGNWCRDVNVCLLWQSWTRESEVSIPQCEMQPLWRERTSQSDVQTTSKICWQIKSLQQQWQEFWQRQCEPVKHRQVPFFVDRSVFDDQIALVATRVAASVAKVVIWAKCVDLLVGTQMLGLMKWNPR